MLNKAKIDRRMADQHRVVSMMPVGKPVSCAELVHKIGDLSPNSVGAFLRNAYKNGLIEKAGTRCMQAKGHYQMATLWIRLHQKNPLPKVQWLEAEDWKWMEYWQQRRQQRLLKINSEKHHAALSATSF